MKGPWKEPSFSFKSACLLPLFLVARASRAISGQRVLVKFAIGQYFVIAMRLYIPKGVKYLKGLVALPTSLVHLCVLDRKRVMRAANCSEAYFYDPKIGSLIFRGPHGKTNQRWAHDKTLICYERGNRLTS